MVTGSEPDGGRAIGPWSSVQPRHSYVRLGFDEPGMDAAIRAVSMYAASIPATQLDRQRGAEGLLVRLLRSRMRLVRSELLLRKLKDTDDDERLQYRAKARQSAYQRLTFTEGEVRILTGGLEELGRRLPRPPSSVERSLQTRCKVMGQAMEAGRRPHSELVAALNARRGERMTTAIPGKQDGKPKRDPFGPALLRVRMREWTVRAAFLGVISYMRYNGASPASLGRAYRLLDRLIGIHRDVIASQVRHGRPGFWLQSGRTVRRGLGIEPNRQAYVTPRFSIQEVRIIQEGLELRRREMARAREATGLGEWRLNKSEAVLLLKTTTLYGARHGLGGRQAGWQVASMIKRMRRAPEGP